jgi:hypothetical protein
MVKKAIVKREPAADVEVFESKSETPEYLRPKQQGPRGGEEVEQRDTNIPRLAICQSMSPYRKEGEKHIENLKEGDYFNTVSGTRYGKSVLVIPLFFYKQQIKFKPFSEGGGIVCQARDGKHGVGDPGGRCLECQFGPILGWSGGGRNKRTPPACTEFKNYACLVIPRDRMPKPEDSLVFSMKTTAIKQSNDWNQRLRMAGLDWWTRIHELTSIEKTNDQNQSWFVPVIKVYDGPRVPASADKDLPPFIVNKVIYYLGESIYKDMQAMHAAGKLTIDLEDEEHESFPGDRQPGDE